MSDEARFPIARASVLCRSLCFAVIGLGSHARPTARRAIHGVASLWVLYRPLRYRNLDSPVSGEQAGSVRPQQTTLRHLHDHVDIISNGMSNPIPLGAKYNFNPLQHLAIDVHRADRAFVVEGGKPNGPKDFFDTLSNPTLVVKDVVYVTMTLVGDTFVTYRLYVVWNRSWLIVVLSSILVLATAGVCPILIQLGSC